MEYIGICANERKDLTPEPSKYPAHSHDSYEIFLPLTSPCQFEVTGYHYGVERGSLLLFSPNEPHRLLVRRGEPLHYLYAQFTSAAIPDDRELRGIVEALFHQYPPGERNMWQLSQYGYDYVTAGMKRLCVAGKDRVHQHFFRILFPILEELSLYGTPVIGKTEASSEGIPLQNHFPDEIIEYVSLHYAEIRDLSFINKEFHYSTVHANALFKARMEVPLWRYILHIRLDRACDLLLSGTKAETVATACGFGDYSTFYRIFKKSYGITPSECRRLKKKPGLLR